MTYGLVKNQYIIDDCKQKITRTCTKIQQSKFRPVCIIMVTLTRKIKKTKIFSSNKHTKQKSNAKI